MDIVPPGHVVDSVQPIARGEAAQAERVDTRANERHHDERMFTPAPQIDDPVRYEKIARDVNGALVTNGRVAGYKVDSPEAYEIVKNVNTQTDLKISRWSEIAGYMRWGTLGLMASSFTWLSVGLGIGGGASATAGLAAAALPLAAGFGVAALVVGVATLLSVQHVRKLQADRWMDVQGFMQERGATKIGKEVA